MLPAGNRLRRSQDFTLAVRRGRRAGRPLLVVYLHPGPAAEPSASGHAARCDRSDSYPHAVENRELPPRAGFVVSKAIGGAVVRNRVKRRLRHLVRERLDQLPRGSLLVVRALPAAANASYQELAADLDAALRRLLSPKRQGRSA